MAGTALHRSRGFFSYRLFGRASSRSIQALVIGSICVICGHSSSLAQAKPGARGNAPGEWRVWGADLWSTRYSPLEQINSSNFGSLKVAWQWNAGAFGSDEYYRTTPLYANGRLSPAAPPRREAMAIDPASGETLWMWRLD